MVMETGTMVRAASNKLPKFVEEKTPLFDILNIDWRASEELLRRSLNILINTVSQNASSATPCFLMLVKCFSPKEYLIKDNSNVGKYDMASCDRAAAMAHSTIKRIISLAPLSINTLYETVCDWYPYKTMDATIQWAYLKNVLMITQYCPSLIEQILALCVDKTIAIDVGITLEEIPEEDEDSLQFDVEFDQSGGNKIETDEANKLDGMMAILFQYIDSMLGNGERSVVQHANKLLNFPSSIEAPISTDYFFTTLLRVFDKVILNTHKSKYTQFLMFYACRLSALDSSQSYSQRFIVHLLGKLLDINTSKYVRLASAAYLGSYASRALYLPINLVKDTLTVFIDWAVRYLNTVEGSPAVIYNSPRKHHNHNASHNNTSTSPTFTTNNNNDITIDVELHGLFYMVSQSLFYIFCFHNVELAKMTNIDSFAGGFQRVSQSKLNPFKVCLPTVVREFSRIAGKLRWFNAEDILLRNEKVPLPTKTSFGGDNQLESFFPFDPYLLKHSSKYITELYSVWNGGEGEDDEMEESDDEDDSITQEKDTGSDHSLSFHSNMNTPPTTLFASPNKSRSRRASGDADVIMGFTPDVEHDLSYHFAFD